MGISPHSGPVLKAAKKMKVYANSMAAAFSHPVSFCNETVIMVIREKKQRYPAKSPIQDLWHCDSAPDHHQDLATKLRVEDNEQVIPRRQRLMSVNCTTTRGVYLRARNQPAGTWIFPKSWMVRYQIKRSRNNNKHVDR